MVGAPVKPPVNPGDILAGKYQVERVLGIGGMGMVVAATHLDLLEPRALKFIIPSALTDAEAAPRFLREARAAAKLKSEHIAKVYDVGRLDNGAPYMVMEYLEGNDLDALLKTHGSFSPQVAALYALQVCSALVEAHTAGIVHRDLKPANLFLTRRTDGTPCLKVLDFGISKIITPGAELDVTKTQQVLGSPLYMSPEQMRATRSIDARSDIWSLGVILYKMVTGKVPFMAQSITELVAIVLEATPTPPSKVNPALPSGLDAVILRCLRRVRDERYASVVELATDLARFAPPGATAAVEAMARVFAAAARTRSDSFSAVAEEPNRSGSSLGPSPPTAASVAASTNLAPVTTFGASPARKAPALTSAPSTDAAPAATEIPSPADPTTASWGQTSTRVIQRSSVTLIMVVILALIGLAGAMGIYLLLASPAGQESATTAPSSASSTPAPLAAAVVPQVEPQVETPAASASASATAALPSTSEVRSAEAPPPKAIATAKAEPQSKATHDDPSTKSKSPSASPEKPAAPGKSMLGGAPVF
jgi:serine/threonine protein kinase